MRVFKDCTKRIDCTSCRKRGCCEKIIAETSQNFIDNMTIEVRNLAIVFLLVCVIFITGVVKIAIGHTPETASNDVKTSLVMPESNQSSVGGLAICYGGEEDTTDSTAVAEDDEEVKTEIKVVETPAESEAEFNEEETVTYKYNLSENDMVRIAKLVWAEARGECFEGKVAVAAVVLNRYFSGDVRFDARSIYSIIAQPGQFADISYVSQNDLDSVPDCYAAVVEACKGWDPTRAVFQTGAYFFFNPNGVSGYQAQIRTGIVTMSIGNHSFHNDFNE